MQDTLSCQRTNIDESTISSALQLLNQKNDWLESRVQIFALLGNRARLDIVYILLNYKRLCVCDFCDLLNMSTPAISQHLRKLKDSKLLFSKKEGVTVFYAINDAFREELAKYLDIKI